MLSFSRLNKKVLKASFSFLIIAIFISVNSFAQNAELRLNLEKGSKHQITTQITNSNFAGPSLEDIVSKMENTMKIEYEVLDKTNDGIHTIKAMITAVKMTNEAQGMSIHYDSEDPETAQGMGGMVAQQFEPMLNRPVTFKVNTRAEVVEKPDLDSDNLMLNQNLVDDLFMVMPEQKISIGDTWEKTESQNNMSVTTHYEVEDITNNKITLSYYAGSDDIKMEQTENQIQDMNMDIGGKVVFDRKTGKSLSNSLSQTMSGSHPQQGDFFMTTVLSTKLKVK